MPSPSKSSHLVLQFLFVSSRRYPSSTLFPYTTLFRSMRLRLGKVTVADVLAAQPVTTNLLKFMRASIKMSRFVVTGCAARSEERFSRNAETDLVCRLLLEKKKKHMTLSYELGHVWNCILTVSI